MPVLAAGGISHGKAIRKALLAGASGAMLGTRFVATQESLQHPEHKSALLEARAGDTAMSVCFQDGWAGATHRTIRNGTLMRWEAAGCPPVGRRDQEKVTYSQLDPTARQSSDTVPSHPCATSGATLPTRRLYAGQGVDDVRDLPPAGELVVRLWNECLFASDASST